jgi:cytochrome c oxidase subunit 2
MIPTDDLELGDLRLLETDEQVILPIELQIGFIATADDVIHS